MRGQRPTQARIDLGALRSNYAEVARRAAGREPIAVVKADAYGHGAVPVAHALAEAGCRRFAVLSVAEAAELRDAGIDAPVLVLAGVHDEGEAETALSLGLHPVVHHREQCELLAEASRVRQAVLGVHVEVDTGMRRMGVPPAEAVALLGEVAASSHLALDGTFTHYARADEADPAPCLEQLEAFRAVLDEARAAGIDPGLVHVANSAGVLAGSVLADPLPEERAVRPGLALYGASPAAHLDVALEPVMTLATEIVALRAVRAGEGVGYGAEFRAEKDTHVATLAIGYADGVPIATGNRGGVLIRGRRHPIVGRVSMDYVGVDVGDAPVALGDEAVLFGAGAGGRLPVEEAAAAAGTIAYELLVRVGGRVPRIYPE